MISRRLLPILFLGIAACLVIWPAFYNGQPFFFSDTTAYVRGADAGIEKLTGIKSAWSRSQNAAVNPKQDLSASQQTSTQPSVPAAQETTALAGRSVYYGTLLYAGSIAGNFWLTAWLQGLALVAAIALMLRACAQYTLPNFAMMVALLCITPAALFASFLMPDIFAGVTILASSMLIVGVGPRCNRECIFWFLLLTFALLCHSSHVLICAVMLVSGAVAHYTLQPKTGSYGLTLIAAALAVAFIGEVAFNAGVARFLGQTPLRPPFLMARIIGDGPGERYLRSTCPDNGFVVCRFVDRLPLTSDQFLWQEDSGVFSDTDPETRRALSQEQFRFVAAVARHDPVGQAKASLRNTLYQLTLIRVNEFQYWVGDRPNFAAKLPSDNWASMQKTAAYLGTMPIQELSMLSIISALFGFLYISMRLIQHRIRQNGAPRLAVRLASFVLIGVVVNAVVCGTLSTPHNRYQARVVWLLPILGLLLDLDIRQQWWNGVMTRVRNFNPVAFLRGPC